MPNLRRKAHAYITHGDRLLVFRHPYAPEAGLQVPGGTVKEGEHPEEAALREASEETGLEGLKIVRFLGEVHRDMSGSGLDAIYHGHFYHLRYDGDPPETWRHLETDASDGSGPHLFEFFWVRVPGEIPELSGNLGEMLPALLTSYRHDTEMLS